MWAATKLATLHFWNGTAQRGLLQPQVLRNKARLTDDALINCLTVSKEFRGVSY